MSTTKKLRKCHKSVYDYKILAVLLNTNSTCNFKHCSCVEFLTEHVIQENLNARKVKNSSQIHLINPRLILNQNK